MSANLKLFQIIGRLDEFERDGLRIRLDKKEFSYGSDEYVIWQNEEIEDYEMRRDINSMGVILLAVSKKAVE